MGNLLSIDSWTGDFLAERNLVSARQLNEASELAVRWGSNLADVMLTKNWIEPEDYYRALADRFSVEQVDLEKDPLDPDLLEVAEVANYMRELAVPWRCEDGVTTIVTSRPGPELILYARRKWGASVKIGIASKKQIQQAVQSVFSERFLHAAVFDLAEHDPVMSAQTVFTPVQLVVGWAMLSAFALGLALAPIPTLIALNLVMTLFYLGNFLFKAVLIWAGGKHQHASERQMDAAVGLLRDEDLPVYTVLVPMFREPDVLPILANALRELDYPTSRLDIKIVLEEGDQLTIDAATALGLEDIFEIILVPPAQPQTKPKACNYALQFARGDFLVIYDAEDKPEPDQLKKVVVTFDRSPANVACVQCRLNYFNREENWLTRLFTLDYSLWFDLMLPGLEKLKVPIPLGGTSNHFRMDVLRELRAWDPFNVTEDADLGIRLTQKGYEVRLVASTTFEEANVSQLNWIRQRSRWIKGYMQTMLVHTRRPIHLVRSIGVLGLLGFIFFIGGTMLSGLLNPVFWAIFVLWLLTETGIFDPLFPPVLLYLSVFNLLAGNGLFIFVMMLAPFRRNWLSLVPYSVTVFWYWVLMSIAAWKGAWQLITKPFYWEKTEHGLSKHTAAEVSKAQASQTAG
ncbi:glycosyltransferase family 2 protein [Qipengyuania profunda]|uniref:glycosyltransferase family 2 protein n=1 Tax=Qipengyuania profunda TaxID=3113984 RepID=UPI002A188450|nr:glycosyltransferase [Qipengyuania sp. HL-TH1]WPL58130.1 glycosyltransferase [Qipengyuania sp. HL-TH5]